VVVDAGDGGAVAGAHAVKAEASFTRARRRVGGDGVADELGLRTPLLFGKAAETLG